MSTFHRNVTLAYEGQRFDADIYGLGDRKYQVTVRAGFFGQVPTVRLVVEVPKGEKVIAYVTDKAAERLSVKQEVAERPQTYVVVEGMPAYAQRDVKTTVSHTQAAYWNAREDGARGLPTSVFRLAAQQQDRVEEFVAAVNAVDPAQWKDERFTGPLKVIVTHDVVEAVGQDDEYYGKGARGVVDFVTYFAFQAQEVSA